MADPQEPTLGLLGEGSFVTRAYRTMKEVAKGLGIELGEDEMEKVRQAQAAAAAAAKAAAEEAAEKARKAAEVAGQAAYETGEKAKEAGIVEENPVSATGTLPDGTQVENLRAERKRQSELDAETPEQKQARVDEFFEQNPVDHQKLADGEAYQRHKEAMHQWEQAHIRWRGQVAREVNALSGFQQNRAKAILRGTIEPGPDDPVLTPPPSKSDFEGYDPRWDR